MTDTPAKPGHNSGKYKPDADLDAAKNTAYRVTADELRSFVERFESLEVDRKDLAGQQKEVMAEAKGRGYDTAAIRRIIAHRKVDPAEATERQAVFDLYCEALGI